MAKSAKVNKSAAVRDYLKAHPGAKGKEVTEALKAQGIKISPNYVSVIKSKKGAKGQGRRKAAKKAGRPSSASSGGQIESALELARSCNWDFESARHYLGIVQKIHQSLQ